MHQLCGGRQRTLTSEGNLCDDIVNANEKYKQKRDSTRPQILKRLNDVTKLNCIRPERPDKA